MDTEDYRHSVTCCTGDMGEQAPCAVGSYPQSRIEGPQAMLAAGGTVSRNKDVDINEQTAPFCVAR